MIRRPALHVLGCAPACGNPGEACSGYLVTAGGSRILLDCGPGVLGSLAGARRRAARRDRALAPALRSRRRSDPARRTRTTSAWRASGSRPRCTRRRAASRGSTALCEASGHGGDHLTACGLTLDEYDPAGELAIGDARLTFRALVHPGTSHAIRIEAGGAVLVYSGDTALTPALGEHADGRRPAADRGDGAARVRVPPARPARPAASPARAGCKALVLTHLDVRERSAALRQAREAFGGPVLRGRARSARRRLSDLTRTA